MFRRVAKTRCGESGTAKWAGVCSLLVFTIALIAPAQSMAGTVRFLTIEEPPTNYKQGGEITGTSVDIVREMGRRLGEDPAIDLLPPARAFKELQENPNRFIFTAGFTQKRADLGFQPIGPVITRNHLLFARKGSNFDLKSVEDLVAQNLSISGMAADWRSTFLKEEGAVVETTSGHDLNLKKLLGGRTDLWISSDIEAPSVLKEAGVSMDDIEVAYVIKTASSYILASKDTEVEVYDRWKQAYAELTEDQAFVDGYTAKWSDELGMSFGFKPDTGLYVETGGSGG